MLIIEKIEGRIVTVEDGDIHFDITANMINGEFKESDILLQTSDGFYQVNSNATDKRRSDIAALQDELFD